MDLSTWSKPIQHYARWIERESLDAAQGWARRLNASDNAIVEGAVAEAVLWDFLDNRELAIHLADIPGSGGPDFQCIRGDSTFFVEVTNISRAITTKRSGLQEHYVGARAYALLTGQIKQKVIAKARQLADMKVPLLVAVATLHADASHLCIQRQHMENLLYSDPRIAWKWNPETGSTVGRPFQHTDMYLSLFTRSRSTETSRPHISGVLACGLGVQPPHAKVLGVLHPDPLHRFNPDLLPDVPFCSFVRWPPMERIDVHWSDDSDPTS